MDIFESTTSYPAATMPTAQNIYTGTGENALYDVLEKAGVDLGELAHLFDYKRGVAEVTQALSESNEEFVEVRKQAAQLSDPDAIWALFEKHKANVEARRMKSGAGKQMWQRAKPTLVDSQRNTMLTEWMRKTDENYEYALSTTIAQYVRSNNFPAIEKHLQQQVKEGALDEGRAKALLNRAEIDIAARQYNLTTEAIGNPVNAEKALKTFTNARRSGKRVDTFEGIDISKVEPTSYWAFINLAEGIIRDEQTATEEQYSQIINEVSDIASRAMNPSIPTEERPSLSSAYSLIQSKDISAKDKAFLTNKLNDTVAIYAKSGVNAFNTTRDWAFYQDMVKRIQVDKEPLTEMDIHRENLSDKKLGPKLGTPEVNRLIGMLPKNKKDIMKTNYYSEMEGIVDSYFLDSEGKYIAEDRAVEWAEARDKLEDIADEYKDDYVGAKAKIDAMLEPIKEAQAKEISQSIWKGFPKMSWRSSGAWMPLTEPKAAGEKPKEQPRPRSINDFKRTLWRLDAEGRTEELKAYYDKWKDKYAYE